MNKRITSILLCFVMAYAMFAAAMPTFAAGGTCTYTIEADKTTAVPGDTINFTIYMQQTGKQNTMEGTLVIPSGLTFVDGSGVLETGIKETLGWDSVDWTPVPNMILNGFGAESFTGTGKIALMKFQCTVDSTAAANDYDVTMIDLVADDETYNPKTFSCVPATITVIKPAESISLNMSELTLYAGEEETGLIANVAPADCTETVVWSVDKPEVATVDPATGKITAIAPGEATVTAKAGTKTATCKVKVNCIHSFSVVDAKDSTCTDRGWDSYIKCIICDKIFDMSDNPIAEIPYRALNDNHDFDTSEWGYKEADGHAHVCRRNAAHHDEIQPHIPDHEGGATYDYAVKCTACGYVIEPQLVEGKINVEVPFKVTVKKTGEMDPGKEVFKFVVENFGAPTEYVLVQDTVETEGEKTYEGKLIFTIDKYDAGNLSEGFVIRQVKGDAKGWTYDETKFYAIPIFVDSYTNVGGWTFCSIDENDELDHNNPLDGIGFTNSYNAEKPVTPDAPPKTGGSSKTILWIGLVTIAGAVLVGSSLYFFKKRAINR